MFYISRVEILGFWGKYTAISNFDEKVNILIGKNGTGKTTFMDLLQATLRVDLFSLAQLEFDKITIRLQSKGKKRTISVTRIEVENSSFYTAKYKVGKKTYDIPLRENDSYRNRLPRRLIEVYEELKNDIDKYINLASLSVYRIAFGNHPEEDLLMRSRKEIRKPAVDRHLQDLMFQFTGYQLALSEKANEIFGKFQKDVLVSALFQEEFDRKFDIKSFPIISKGQGEKELLKAYRELGILDEETKSRIKKHVLALNSCSEKVAHFLSNINKEEREALSIDDILPLPLFRRTQHIIDLSLKAAKEKQEIISPIRKYLEIAKEFMNDKNLSINTSTGEMIIKKEDKIIDIFDLSSGEKQLLILLTETLLQKNESFIFLADEPEISLHIEWQAKVISSIRKLNSSSQIIVATHSPEIAAGWKEHLIDMENIINV